LRHSLEREKGGGVNIFWPAEGFTKRSGLVILAYKQATEMIKENKRNRSKDLLEIVRGLLLSEVAFQEIYKKYRDGTLRFLDIGDWVDDKGQSLLYNLKQQCHSLFRYTEKVPIQKNEWLLDLAIGSIFHEAMKLRENIYQLEVYRPKYVQYKLKAGKSSSAYESDYLQQFERIISKAEQGLEEGMEETRSLFKDAMTQLPDFFKENSRNPYLVRFLLERQPLLQRVYGVKKAKEVFDTMFERGLPDAYVLAGQSYLTSEHYDLSIHYFSKALKMDPLNHELQFFLNFSLGMNAYYQNAYSKALSYFAKLVHLRLSRKLKREYLKKAEDVCYRISSELRDEKKVRTTARCRFLADEIRKML
jgi:tetratricopeptide (TPR) repeat protein